MEKTIKGFGRCLSLLIGMILMAGTGSWSAYAATAVEGISSAPDAPDRMLRVGLQFGSVKDTSLTIKSDFGFRFGSYQAENFLPLIDFENSPELVLIKNGYTENETLITTPTGSSPLINGKYHIQVGAVQQTFEAIQPVYDKVKALNPEAFLAYDDGWRVYIGAYYTQAQFDASYAAISNQLMPLDTVKAPFNYSAFMVLENNKVKLLFATVDTDFGFESFQTGRTIGFNKYKYRGGLVFKRMTASDPTVINYIPAEQYLYGVLPYEISPKWPIEAQKAQAVAARNYAITNLNKHKKHGFDVCNTIDCQVYAGANVESALSNQAVDLTKGLYLKYNGKLANTVYHSNSGGRTENSENIWTTALPYLVGVDDPYSIGSPNDVWSASFSAEQLTQKLIAKKYDIGTVTDVYVEQYSANGRAMKTTFVGTKGKVSFDKDKVRSLFSDADVKTNYFTIVKPGGLNVLTDAGTVSLGSANLYVLSAEKTVAKNTTADLTVTDGTNLSQMPKASNLYTFNGKGWGHGVGMSQWGSKRMAELGYTFDQILLHYYQNTYLEK